MWPRASDVVIDGDADLTVVLQLAAKLHKFIEVVQQSSLATTYSMGVSWAGTGGSSALLTCLR